MANHRAEGRARIRPLATAPGTHRDSSVSAGAAKVGVLGALATATIAVPLASATAGDQLQLDASPQQQEQPQASVKTAPSSVEIPTVQDASTQVRAAAETASRHAGRDKAPADSKEKGEDSSLASQITVKAPEDEPASLQELNTRSAESSVPVGGSGYMRPVDGPVTSPYGFRIHPVLGYRKMHEGVDYGNACGTPIHSAAGGVVTAREYHPTAGNRVHVDHGNGVTTVYFHLQGFNVSKGQKVQKGEILGYVGTTGRSTGCHLHFGAMDSSGNYFNPSKLFR